MTSVRRSLAIAFAERYALILLSLAGNVLLARLLTPEEIGIYSVSLAVIGIAQVLRDFGVGSFLIQEKNLTEAHVRTAFGVSLIIGSTLAVALYFAAPWVVQFYSEPRLAETMRISAINFLVLPFCIISLSLLRRDMEFARIMAVTLAAAAVGFLTSIALAFSGFGPNSMAVGAVATNIVTGAGAWLARRDRKVLLPALSEWRAVLNFGGQVTASGIVTTISVDINDLALGRILGFAPVAMISRAQGLMNIFHRDVMSAIRGVAFPAFAKAHRQGDDTEAGFVAAVTNVTAIAWPFYGFVSLFALEITRIMFGPQWDEASRLAPLFCLAGAIAATSSLVLTAVMAVGRVELVTFAEMVFQPLRAALVVVAAIAFRSLWACAVAYLLASALHTPFVYLVKQRSTRTDFASLRRGLARSAMVSLGCLAPAAAICMSMGVDRTSPMGVIPFVAAIVLTVTAWLMCLRLTAHPIADDPLFHRLFGMPPDESQETV